MVIEELLYRAKGLRLPKCLDDKVQEKEPSSDQLPLRHVLASYIAFKAVRVDGDIYSPFRGTRWEKVNEPCFGGEVYTLRADSLDGEKGIYSGTRDNAMEHMVKNCKLFVVAPHPDAEVEVGASCMRMTHAVILGEANDLQNIAKLVINSVKAGYPQLPAMLEWAKQAASPVLRPPQVMKGVGIMASYLAFSRVWHDWTRLALPKLGLKVLGGEEMRGESIKKACELASDIAIVAPRPGSKVKVYNDSAWWAEKGFAVCKVRSLQAAARLILASYSMGYEQLSGTLRWAREVLGQLSADKAQYHEASKDIFTTHPMLKELIFDWAGSRAPIEIVEGKREPMWLPTERVIVVGKHWPLMANTLYEMGYKWEHQREHQRGR